MENLVHFDAEDAPEDLYIIEIEVYNEDLIFKVPDSEYPEDWLNTDNLNCKLLGDSILFQHKFLGIKVRSAVNQSEYNVLLDPLFPGYHELLQINSVTKVKVDQRLR